MVRLIVLSIVRAGGDCVMVVRAQGVRNLHISALTHGLRKERHGISLVEVRRLLAETPQSESSFEADRGSMLLLGGHRRGAVCDFR